VLPRASGLGHLAGVMTGYGLLYAELIPMVHLQPMVALPILYAVFRYVSPSTALAIEQRHGRRHLRVRYMDLAWGGLTMCGSVLVYGAYHPLTLGCALVSLFLGCEESMHVLQVRFVLAVLVLITDAMTCAAWVILGGWHVWSMQWILLILWRFSWLVRYLCQCVQCEAWGTPSKDHHCYFYYALGVTFVRPITKLSTMFDVTTDVASHSNGASRSTVLPFLGTGHVLR
jgi:hypothetical protein